MRKKPKSYHDLQSGRFLKARSYNYETSCGYEVRSLHELLVAENLIANGVSHDYEPALHCGNHTLFPDFLAEDWFWKGPNRAFWFSRSTDMDTIVGETQAVSVVQGSRSNIGRSSRTRQGNCTQDYEATKFAHSDDFNQRHETPTSQCCKFKGLIREYSNRVIRRGLASLPTYERETISLVSTDSDVTEGPMVDILIRRGFSRAEIEKVRIISDLKKRLIEAIRLADSHQIVPREAMIEMMAGVYQSSVCHHFGSMNSLALAADMEAGKSLARVHGHSISCGPVAQPDPEMRILKR